MVPIIDHIGIAVNSLGAALPLYEAILGIPASGTETVESEGVRVAFFGTGAGRVELLEPLGPDSPLARFLERRGGGLHHICLAVPDLDEAIRRAGRAGARLIEPAVRGGADGARVAFLHPRSTDGVLLELRETATREPLDDA